MVEFIRKRDGRLVPFEEEKIARAIIKAVQAVGGTDLQKAAEITRQVGGILSVLYKEDRVPTVENVQDLVEKILIENGHARTAKAYILYREERARRRREKAARGYGGASNIPWRKIYEVLRWSTHHDLHTVGLLNARIAQGRLPIEK